MIDRHIETGRQKEVYVFLDAITCTVDILSFFIVIISKQGARKCHCNRRVVGLGNHRFQSLLFMCKLVARHD